jgi:PilZ domain
MSRIWQALRQAEQERRGLRTSEASIEEMDREPAEADESSTARALDRRKVLRHSYQATLLVYGSDAEKQPFHENCQTIDANDTGCLFSLASSVSRGQRLFLTNMRTQAELECRVVYVGRRVQGKSRVGVEFLRPSPHFWRGE